MKEITAARITEAVAALCIKANKILPSNLEARIHEAAAEEQSTVGKAIFDDLIANTLGGWIGQLPFECLQMRFMQEAFLGIVLCAPLAAAAGGLYWLIEKML